jgi:hypothetical protein
MISIDQNCHSLWDVIPKLNALAAAGRQVRPYVEDIDVAFTSMGSRPHAGALHLERERFYRSGGEDWGAALFYSEFLGRQAVEIRQWEPLTGMKTDVLARHLGRSVDDLYDEFSPGDNWQLIGPSYVGDDGEPRPGGGFPAAGDPPAAGQGRHRHVILSRHHRTIGDLQTSETQDYLMQIVGIARHDMLRSFPEAAPTRRLTEWFARLEEGLRQWLAGSGRLADVYDRWLRREAPAAQEPRPASELLPCRPGRHVRVLELFTRDYDRLAALYNQAVEQSRLGLRPLETAQGELPFFGVYRYKGHMVRSGAVLQGRQVVIGDRTFDLDPQGRLPLEAMAHAGIVALPGKAIVLVLQIRAGADGQALAMPYHGSMYMPAAFALQKMLQDQHLLDEPVQPVVRVRLHFLDRLSSLDTTICLPPHLRPYFGRDEIPARELGRNWQALQQEATQRLAKFRDAGYRPWWQRQAMPDLAAEIDRLDAQRRSLAAADSKAPALRQLWKQVGPLKVRQLETMVRQISLDWQMSQIDYWDSRGALWPWSVALGGEAFYRDLIGKAEIYEQQT